MALIKDKIAGLYIAFFNRAADKSGLDYWVSTASNLGENLAVKQLAAGFASHPKFSDLYDHLDNLSYVESIYINVLGQTGDVGGINYWKSLLDSGISRSDMVADFVSLSLDFDRSDSKYASLSEEALNAAQERKDLISNKVAVSLDFVEKLKDKTNLDLNTDPMNSNSLNNDEAYQASIKILSKITYRVETVENIKNFLETNSNIESINNLSEEELKSIADPAPINQNPIANAGTDQTITIGDLVTLDASSSYDTDGEIVAYEWSKNGIILSTNESFTNSSFEIGTHNITLNVTDDDGYVDTDIMNLIVETNLTGPGSDLLGFGSQYGVWMSGYYQPGYKENLGLQNNSDNDYTINSLEIFLGNLSYYNMNWGTTISYNEWVQFPAQLNNAYLSDSYSGPFTFHYNVENNTTGEEYEIILTGGNNDIRYNLTEDMYTLL